MMESIKIILSFMYNENVRVSLHSNSNNEESQFGQFQANQSDSNWNLLLLLS